MTVPAITHKIMTTKANPLFPFNPASQGEEAEKFFPEIPNAPNNNKFLQLLAVFFRNNLQNIFNQNNSRKIAFHFSSLTYRDLRSVIEKLMADKSETGIAETELGPFLQNTGLYTVVDTSDVIKAKNANLIGEGHSRRLIESDKNLTSKEREEAIKAEERKNENYTLNDICAAAFDKLKDPRTFKDEEGFILNTSVVRLTDLVELTSDNKGVWRLDETGHWKKPTPPPPPPSNSRRSAPARR